MPAVMSDIPPVASIEHNIHEYSVGEISQAVKRTLEGAFDHVRVRGEVSRPNYHGSGHLYFTLKDESAAIDGVCWRGTVGRLGLRLEEGMEVVCTGRISSYPRSSRYQIVIESIELAGEGALLKLLEDRRKKLAAEGLFDPERKRELPFLPEVIGVVTSPTGAVIRDILHRLADRFPRHVLLWPVVVQGEGAAEQVAAAIAGFNGLAPGGPIPRPDVLIVARGGGSLEDLWAFNEEVVVRAAAASSIPLISAIGHETDTTLIDHAADRRAPTPTAAAEMAVPVRAEIAAQILDLERRAGSGLDRLIREQALRIEGLGRGLPDPGRLLEQAWQDLDDRTDRLGRAVRTRLETLRQGLARVFAGIRDPRLQLDRARDRLGDLSARLATSARARLRGAEAAHAGLDAGRRLPRGLDGVLRTLDGRLGAATGMLESLSYVRVLERGYAVIRGAAGNPIPRAADAVPGEDIVIQFADDRLDARLAGKANPGAKPGAKPGPKPKAKSPKRDDPQRNLL